ncbi:AMP-dependent synthetase [Methylophilales bacterium MBRSG12]|uniref:Acetyl-coenzyme A synthetase n=1 Tax=Methylophilales bacterium MBRS-H7 TaxID=1623450 RepID=A0A0H4IZX4_9PROT|nr:AMP-dependent synthetase [Methylophilales bacterium MBRSF5]AKO65330.1 AMP-dependent synthetase [Methylophilales bacterium MBRS-H7]AKO66649.1 AMP-dependent synthetase [Methylophilales bacterium MBRSG12]
MAIESVMHENRVFNPPKTLSENAYVKNLEEYQQLCDAAEADYEGYWGDLAKDLIDWKKPFTKILNEDDAPFYKWFDDGELNVSYNCIDRHLPNKKDKVAIIFESDDGQTTEITYQELYEKVCQFANGLKTLNLNLGDRVIIYLPMGIEAVVAMQACARIGLTHSVVFGGFSAKSIQERVIDAGAKLIITADYQNRGGKELPLKTAVDDAILLGGCDSVEKVIVLNRTGKEAALKENEIDWHALCKNQKEECEPVWVNAEHPLFLLYTSGSTGKPKGVQHSSGGYLLHAINTTKWTFDLRDDDIFWCTADVGWITGHTYVAYGPLALGGTQIIFEGVPTFPNAGRFWEIVQKYKATIFYTAPTAIRALIKASESDEAVHPKSFDLSSLRILGTVGEPINPEAWMWYYENVGNSKCPIADTFWQTETGGHVITPLPGSTPLVPGSCTLPFPGIAIDVVDETGQNLEWGQGGLLVIKKPWPSMIRTIWGDPERFKNSYFPSELGGKLYLAGDGAVRDAESGYFTIMGRIDDVLNVSGHRLGTMEIESALVANDLVAEAAVVGRPHDVKGESIIAFVVLKSDRPNAEKATEIVNELRAWVGNEIGPIAKPDEIRFGDNLPKTRSGKIMRRLLRSIAKDEEITADISTLENPAILDQLKQKV